MKRTIVILYIALFVQTLLAQREFIHTHYSSEDGLSQNTVMDMMQDHNGVMWFATWDGINKFDGYRFTTYKARQDNRFSLTNNRVDFIAEDKYGFIWLQSYDNRIHRFTPETEVFEQVPAQGEGANMNIVEFKVLPNGVVWLLTQGEGAIRVVTNPQTKALQSTVFSNKNEGLSSLHINQVWLDKGGREWVLTDNGLAMMGKGKREFSVYFSTKNDKRQATQHFYACNEFGTMLYFASDKGRLWGYNGKTGRFELIQFAAKGALVDVKTLDKDHLVVATEHEGFFVYCVSTRQTTAYTPQNTPDYPHAKIRSLFVDSRHEVWIELDEAQKACHFNPQTKQLHTETLYAEKGSAARSNPAYRILEDKNGFLWVHPNAGGFSFYDREKGCLVPFYNKPGSPDWLFSNKIHSMMSDKQGNLWICSHSEGIEKFVFTRNQFTLKAPKPLDYETLQNEVRALYEDDEHSVWCGLKDGSLFVYNQNGEKKGYLTESGQLAFSGKMVTGVAYCITQDRQGTIWIGTKGDGVIRAQKSGNGYKLTRFTYNEDDIYSLSDNNVYSIHADSNNRVWVATFGGGLNMMVPDGKGGYRFINHRNNLKNYPIDRCNRVRFITEDKKGNLWVGTTTGVLRCPVKFKKPEDALFYHYSRRPGDLTSLSNNDVFWIKCARNGAIYFATFGGGLNKLLSVKGNNATFKSYTEQDGLASDILLSIQEDNDGYLWISTENGLSRFYPQKGLFETFKESELGTKARFVEGASCTMQRGIVLFGTSGGVLQFRPNQIAKSTYVPNIIFSKLLIANKEIQTDPETVLPRNLNDLDQLVLSHKENIITIHFSALDMKAPENIQYAYMLEGFEQDWQYVGNQRSATYTNLPKGTYVLHVKSTNADGVWCDNERALTIVVKASFWETPWAYMLYMLLFFGLIFVIVYVLFTFYRLKHKVSVEQQITDIKLRFFTNISHELRTPLTLITGPLENVMERTDLPKDVHEQLQIASRNTDRMLRLINQILDFRKIQNRKMKMRVQYVEVVSKIRDIMHSFDNLAEEHHIDFVLESEQPQFKLWIDTDKFEKIMFNLISNAFKYTPVGKMIRIAVFENEQSIAVCVQDQGVGISEEKRDSLFIRFENLLSKNLFNQETTGIGLSLVKELVDMHHGTITVDSVPGIGSTFTVSLKKGRDHYEGEVEYIIDDSVKSADFLSADKEEQGDNCESKKNMLLVEDNLELRFFLRSIFSGQYNILEASNGQDGYDKAQKFIPDFIISDIMMEQMDGLEMTKKLRASVATSHIPIVLLTAKTDTETQMDGLKAGADDFIIKPFSASVLKIKVSSILSRRANLNAQYRERLLTVNVDATDRSEENVLSEADRKFMEKLTALMEQNMDNGNLMVDDLVKELAVSRSVFFKKLKSLTGMAPIEFIKELRIKRAAELIGKNEYNITQVAYMVGINDPRYFSKCFKARFGMTPSEYREKLGLK